ncbi:hypothetical protein Tco_0654826 [Tanacetum coccineum]|uniref:Uncharacterized protein n=1 Tax=Tanacetum coccineum TaxID=301880 RepID=A0ABQ4X4K7_9ASTR
MENPCYQKLKQKSNGSLLETESEVKDCISRTCSRSKLIEYAEEVSPLCTKVHWNNDAFLSSLISSNSDDISHFSDEIKMGNINRDFSEANRYGAKIIRILKRNDRISVQITERTKQRINHNNSKEE